ncbi:MAG: VOC family protein [Marinicaulis sp.]|nr:VOC family protein [Marinicaulis sp.]
MTLSIYLTFNGNCADAFNFYKTVFGGDFEMISTFGDGPPEMGVADSDKDKIMHVSYRIGDSVLMGSDTAESFGGPSKQGNNFSISHTPSSKADADDKFAKLSDGGAVIMPMQDQFWGSYFGQCVDKFGIQWMLNISSS